MTLPFRFSAHIIGALQLQFALVAWIFPLPDPRAVACNRLKQCCLIHHCCTKADPIEQMAEPKIESGY